MKGTIFLDYYHKTLLICNYRNYFGSSVLIQQEVKTKKTLTFHFSILLIIFLMMTAFIQNCRLPFVSVRKPALPHPQIRLFPTMLCFDGWRLSRLIAKRRSHERLLAMNRLRVRLWSSLNDTSSTQCSEFSMPQWPRTASANRLPLKKRLTM